MKCIALLLSVLLGLSSMAEATTYLVRPDGTGDFPTIQEAVDATSAGDVIELAPGVFAGLGNRGILLDVSDLTIRSQAATPDQCTIDCEGMARAFAIYAAGTLLEGFTVTHGYEVQTDGGGVEIRTGSSDITIVNCAFRENVAIEAGGGAVSDRSRGATLRQCRFIDNAADFGGALFAEEDDYAPTVEGCEFTGNTGALGSAVYLFGTTLAAKGGRNGLFRSCLFARNTDEHGGCVALTALSPTFQSCTFVHNAGVHGAILCQYTLEPSSPLISHSIIAFSIGQAAVSCEPECQPTLECSDIFGNAGGDWVGCIEGQQDIAGNIAADPLFCDAAGSDFTLEEASFCAPTFNPDCGLIGAFPVGCGSTPIQRVTCGSAKALFR